MSFDFFKKYLIGTTMNRLYLIKLASVIGVVSLSLLTAGCISKKRPMAVKFEVINLIPKNAAIKFLRTTHVGNPKTMEISEGSCEFNKDGTVQAYHKNSEMFAPDKYVTIVPQPLSSAQLTGLVVGSESNRYYKKLYLNFPHLKHLDDFDWHYSNCDISVGYDGRRYPAHNRKRASKIATALFSLGAKQ
jgi:hypothetical protein